MGLLSTGQAEMLNSVKLQITQTELSILQQNQQNMTNLVTTLEQDAFSLYKKKITENHLIYTWKLNLNILIMILRQ